MERSVSVNQAIYYRNYRRARDRALTRLSKEYPDVYRQYLEEEKASDEVNGKKWNTVTDTVTVKLGIQSYKDTIEGRVNPDDEGENASNDGGEA
ncbi:MAG: hypothetical protein ACR2IJ_09435 [Fluviibacter sp.]